jgi:hypothetical protein
MLAGFAVFFEPAHPQGTGNEELPERSDEEAARLVSLLQTLAIAACTQLMVLCRTTPLRVHSTRRDAFVLAKLLDSLLADAGMKSSYRQQIKSLLDRQTTLELLLPIAARMNALIEGKGRDQNRSIDQTEKQKISLALLEKLESTLDMYRALIRHLSDTQALSLAERVRICEEMTEELTDLKEWVANQRLRRPHLWLGTVEQTPGLPASDASSFEDPSGRGG